MAKGKYASKFSGVTAELFNDYYEDTNTVVRRKMANNATSQKSNSVNIKKAVSSKQQQNKGLKKQGSISKPVITNALKQTASFLNNQKLYQQEFPTLGQSYKSAAASKPQQQLKQKPQQLKQKPQQQLKKQQPQKIVSNVAQKTYKSPATYTAKQTEELLREFYSLCQSYNGMTYFGSASFQNNCWSKNSSGKWINSCSIIALKNAPVVRRIQQSQSRKVSQIQSRKVSQSQSRKISKQPTKLNEASFITEFSNICQCYDGMNYFGNSAFQKNSWSKTRNGVWVNAGTTIALKNAPVVRKIQQSQSRKISQTQSRKVSQPQSRKISKQPTKLNEASFITEFSNICQCYDGMNYFGNSAFQKSSWSKTRSGGWVNASIAIALKNAPIILIAPQKVQSRRASRIQARKASKQQIQLSRQASIKTQPVKQLSKQQAENVFNNEFKDICQCFDGMNYFGNSLFQKNTWSKNRSGNWISSSSAISLKNAPIVHKSFKVPTKKQSFQQVPTKRQSVQPQSRNASKVPAKKQSLQAPVKRPSVQPQSRKASKTPVKKQSIQQARKLSRKQVINSQITKEQQQMNQKCIVAQQNASLKLQNKILKQFREKQQQLEKKKKLEEQQKLKRQQEIQMKKNSVRKQSAKQINLKKQQLQKEKKRALRKESKRLSMTSTKRNLGRQSKGITRSQAKKQRKRQNLINAINKRIQELVAEKQQKQLFSQMVKQKTAQILKQRSESTAQKNITAKKLESTSKIQEKEAYEKQKKRVQKKLLKQKMQGQKASKKSGALEAQKKMQLAELKNKLTPEQFSKIQSLMQQNGNKTKEQNARQIQSEQAKKNWQEQVKKMKARQQEIQQKQQKQALMKKRFQSIKRKLTPKQQENLMNNLKKKEQQKSKMSQLKNRQPKANNNNKSFIKKQTKQPVKQIKQTINKKQMTVQKPTQQKASKVQQWKVINSKPMNASETKMFNNEFSDLCNMYEINSYVTYSNYKTWSKNKFGNSISNASVIASRNAPKITKGLSKQMNFRKGSKIQNAKPQQVRNNKSNKSRY